MTRRRSAMLGVLVLGFVGAGLTGACGSNEPGPVDSCPTPPETPTEDTSTECTAAMPDSCMRYRIPILGDTMNVALRSKYIAAFGSACYVSEGNTFDCFYKDPLKACADAVKIPDVIGAAPYDNYPDSCKQVAGTEDYSLQVGPDVANKIPINFQPAPRETPLIDVKSVPTEVSGPYRNLTEPQKLAPGQNFYCNTVDKNGATIKQKDLILQVNRDAHGGEIHSDLAGFEYPCGVDENCKPKTCIEPLVLKAGPQNDPEAAQVHHVVRRKDERGCPWGTNSNKNAAVISFKLNRFLWYKYPSADEVMRINKVPPYTP